MLRLAMALFGLISTTFMSTAVVVALVAGITTLAPLLAAAAIGFVLSFPATWFIARAIAGGR